MVEVYSVVKRIKHILCLLFIISSFNQAQIVDFKLGQVRGLFLELGVGPTFPVGDFAVNHTLGSKIETAFSYADNDIFPIFVYGKIKYAMFQADFVEIINNPVYELSTQIISFEPGIRFYIPPFEKKVILLMPYIDTGFDVSYLIVTNQQTKGIIAQFTNNQAKMGLHLGVGVSMFLLDTGVEYNYHHGNQYLGLNVKLRLPIFIKV